MLPSSAHRAIWPDRPRHSSYRHAPAELTPLWHRRRPEDQFTGFDPVNPLTDPDLGALAISNVAAVCASPFLPPHWIAQLSDGCDRSGTRNGRDAPSLTSLKPRSGHD